MLGYNMLSTVNYTILLDLSWEKNHTNTHLFAASVVSDSVWPHRRQPKRFPRPWDSPSKNTGVGCHFLLQCRKVKSESEVTQLCPTLSDPMDCSLPGSSAHGIFQARVLEWGAIAFSLHLFRLNNDWYSSKFFLLWPNQVWKLSFGYTLHILHPW